MIPTPRKQTAIEPACMGLNLFVVTKLAPRGARRFKVVASASGRYSRESDAKLEVNRGFNDGKCSPSQF